MHQAAPNYIDELKAKIIRTSVKRAITTPMPIVIFAGFLLFVVKKRITRVRIFVIHKGIPFGRGIFHSFQYVDEQVNAVSGGISRSSIKIWANHDQIILYILLHLAKNRDMFDLSHHKG